MAELGLAIVGTVDLCFKWGKKLVELCSAFRHADSELGERVLMIKATWIRTSSQLVFLKQIVNEMEPEYLEIQKSTVAILALKLSIVVSNFESVLRKAESSQTIKAHSDVKAWKYAIMKKSIDSAIADLKAWQEVFDPSWFLIMKTSAPHLDREQYRHHRSDPGLRVLASAQSLRTALSSHHDTSVTVFLPEDGLNGINGSIIEFTNAQAGSRTNSKGETSSFILEEVICPAGFESSKFTENVRNLARKLQQSDPKEFGLMNCKGVVQEGRAAAKVSPKLTFVFRMPEGFQESQSLRRLLINGPEALQSLSERFDLARQLAKSVGYVHTFGFVHKNIRPETVLIFKTPDSTVTSSSLIGFESFRTADGRTLQSGDSVWERNLYRHPDRQGEHPKEIYIMQHDIYSLGVCLLEIGLWKSFVDYDETRTKPGPSGALEVEETNILAAVDQLSVRDSDNFSRRNLRSSVVSKDHLVWLARQKLPPIMGTRYAEVVETCLTCLDPDNVDFGDEKEFCDDDGILVGVRYIEKVVMQLNDIRV